MVAAQESEAALMNAYRHDKPATLPDPIVAALNNLIRRARHLTLLRGLCASCVAGIGAFLLIMLLDATVTLLAAWPRWTLTLLAYAGWACTTYGFLIRPLTRTFTLAGISRLIETHHPEFQERISSAVQILASKDLPSIRGSDTLIAALTEEALRRAITLKPRQEISFRTVIPLVAIAAILISILTTLCLLRPHQTGFLLARATAPFLNLPNVQAADLIIEPGDTMVAAGTSLQISLHTANPAVKSAKLLLVNRNNRETTSHPIPLIASLNQSGRHFAITLPAVQGEFRYRIHAGDALSRYFTVRVALPPVIQHLEINYAYPEYSHLGTKMERDGSRTIRALAGTTVTASVQVNKPMRRAQLFITTPTVTNSITGVPRAAGKDTIYDFTLSLPTGLNGRWSLRFSDDINLVNTPYEHPIQAIADNPPTVTIANPLQRELHLNRNTCLPVSYVASDDIGLTAATLVFTLPGLTNDLLRTLPFPISSGDTVRTTLGGEIPITLADPVFTNVPWMSFRIRATDNLPDAANGPQHSDSETYTITFDDKADSWAEQVLSSQNQRVMDGLRDAQKQLIAARDHANTLNGPLAAELSLTDNTTRIIDSLQDTLASADKTLLNTAADLRNGFFNTLAANLTSLAEDHVSKAGNLAGQLRLVDTPAERTTINSNVSAQITTSLAALQQALKAHEAAMDAAERAVQLEQLAAEQNALAATRAETEPAEQPAWQDAENQVAAELARIARHTPGATDPITTANSNLAATASAQASELAKRQTDLAELTEDQLTALQQQAPKWHELALRQDQLASLARKEPLAASQDESMRNVAQDLESARGEEAITTQSNILENLLGSTKHLLQTTLPTPPPDAAANPDSSRDLANRAAILKTTHQTSTLPPKPDAAQTKDTAQKALQQARDANALADRAAKQAEQSAEKANLAAKQSEQQTTAARQSANQGNQPEAQAAKQATQAAQAAAQQAQKARQAAYAAQQAAQQAGTEAPKAAPPSSPRNAEHALNATLAAAKTAIAKATEAAEAAIKADGFSAMAQRQADAGKLSTLARQQQQLQQETAALLANQQATSKSVHAKQLAHNVPSLPQDRPFHALQAEQAQLSRQISDLTPPTKNLQSQAGDGLLPPQSAARATRASLQLEQAIQSANDAATNLRNASDPEGGPSANPSAQQQESARRARQQQQTAARALQQTAALLQEIARNATPPSTATPAQTGQSSSPKTQQAIAQAYQATRQAAQSSSAADASKAAEQLAQAAQQAAEDARTQGANPNPSSLRSPGRNGRRFDTPDAPGENPALTRRLGLKLQDWLRLHGELKDDVLQAANSEGPEEYRPIIQRYFREISSHEEGR